MIWRAITLFSVAAIGGYLGFLVTDREPPTEIFQARAVPDVVHPGSRVEIEFHARRHRSCKLHVVRYVYDARGIRHVLSDLDFPAGSLPVGEETYRVLIDVPKDAALGPAKYQSVNTYACNWLQLMWPISDPREAKFTIEPG